MIRELTITLIVVLFECPIQQAVGDGIIKEFSSECWTKWFDRDNPSGSGDWELLTDLRNENPNEICDSPLQIEVQTTSGESVASTGDMLVVTDKNKGLVCKNSDQKHGLCADYRVRFMCPSSFCSPQDTECWTKWFDQNEDDGDSGSGDVNSLMILLNENTQSICQQPHHIRVQTASGLRLTLTGDINKVAETVTEIVCKSNDNWKVCEDYRVCFKCPSDFCIPLGCWTDWFDRDNPSGSGDWETLHALRSENPNKICDNPLQIDVQTTSGSSVASTGNVIAVSNTEKGFVCKNSDQKQGKCADYHVRFLCPSDFCTPSGCWTDWFDRDNPSGSGDWESLHALRSENPNKICDNPLKIDVQTTSGATVASTGDEIAVSNTEKGFVCKNSDQTQGKCADYRVRFQCPTTFCNPSECWTDWFDRDNPSGSGDWELLSDLHSENPNKICNNPLQIKVQTTAGSSVASTGDIISVRDPNIGFVCKNSEQEQGRCEDYRVRFLCPTDFCTPEGSRCWTDWFDRDNPSGSGDWETLHALRSENPNKICDNPLKIDVETTSGDSVASTGDEIAVSDTDKGFVCKNSDQEQGKCADYRVRFKCPADFCKQQVCWTKWYDRDNPSGSGDWETLSSLRHDNPGEICETPLNIEVVTTDTNTPATSTGQIFSVSSPSSGFVCINDDQPGDKRCRDYKVRFGCPCS